MTITGSPDGPVFRDESLHALEEQGWERLRRIDAVSGLPEPEGWWVGLRDERLTIIDDGRGGWLAFASGVDPVPDEEWERASRNASVWSFWSSRRGPLRALPTAKRPHGRSLGW